MRHKTFCDTLKVFTVSCFNLFIGSFWPQLFLRNCLKGNSKNKHTLEVHILYGKLFKIIAYEKACLNGGKFVTRTNMLKLHASVRKLFYSKSFQHYFQTFSVPNHL